MNRELKIGTRGSPLALAQAAIVRDLLIGSGLVAGDAIETVIIRTSGDRIQDRALADIGGKGLFTKEIEEALADGRIDLAVHSLKDLPAWMPDGLTLAAVLSRADPRDARLSNVADSIAALPQGAKVGTSSPRRRALLLHVRPDLHIVDFRGNVGTRLAKLEAGEVDATLLAVAGMGRLGLAIPYHALEPAEMLPAACQGAIGLETRIEDERVRAFCAALNHPARQPRPSPPNVPCWQRSTGRAEPRSAGWRPSRAPMWSWMLCSPGYNGEDGCADAHRRAPRDRRRAAGRRNRPRVESRHAARILRIDAKPPGG